VTYVTVGTALARFGVVSSEDTQNSHPCNSRRHGWLAPPSAKQNSLQVMQSCAFLPREVGRDGEGEYGEQSEAKQAKENIPS
jgi:hypothetical protein